MDVSIYTIYYSSHCIQIHNLNLLFTALPKFTKSFVDFSPIPVQRLYVLQSVQEMFQATH